MSRIGKLPITIPKGTEINISDENEVFVKGPKGELSQRVDTCITIKKVDNQLLFERQTEQKQHKSMHGLYRSLINNMIVGVTKGYKKEMELIGVGYRANSNGRQLELLLGYSHNIIIEVPKEVSVETKTERGKNPLIILESNDKQLLGLVAAKIRSLRKPEPYKGKGIRFVGEFVRRKAGKTASSSK